MILRKYMSLLGVGSAKIDLILPKTTYHQGEMISGNFSIKGGTIEQLIKRIDCDLVMKDEITGEEKVIDTTSVLTTKLIESDELNQFPFRFKLPDSISYSSSERSYRFKTRLTFTEGVESKDQDFIQIIPYFS
ncbi:sporulation protein [Bacillus sp. CGMCC 1.16607]|uniref:sporulation protein n=1 Tax=Bacillus sp. CGMCC 1.16607 TaxID=3351842 RepID=UPI003627A903